MHYEFGREADGVTERESWARVVADAAPRDHIVQLYQDQDFLNRAVCRFAGAALANGEGIILVPTLTHWNAIRPRLEAEGVDVEGARERGQLTVVDADEFLPRFMQDAMPDAPVFLGLAADVIGQARAGGRYPKVRWWGEMVNVLWERGDVAASMNLEDLFDQLAQKHDIAIFCSFLMDKFDPKIYDEAFGNVCSTHSHVIPANDYARHRLAVNQAVREVIGEIRGSLLQSLVSWQGPSLMPTSQATLLWVRERMPAQFPAVLARARELEHNPAAS
jgi:hypothetical protein